MTWFSEYSASPRRRLASSAIRCPSVDRFAGSVPPPVFPASGPLCATPPFPRSGPGEPGSPTSAVLRRRYDFPCASTRSLMDPVPGSTCSSVFVFAMALPQRRRSALGPGDFGQPVSPLRRPARGHARDLSGFLALLPHLCPDLRPRPDQQDLALIGPADAAPGTNTPKAPAKRDLGAQPRALVSAAYASRAALPPPMQGSLPAGGLRPLPGGSRTLWSAMTGFRLHPSSFPGLCLTQIGSSSLDGGWS